jgi:hypothetical protein
MSCTFHAAQLAAIFVPGRFSDGNHGKPHPGAPTSAKPASLRSKWPPY